MILTEEIRLTNDSTNEMANKTSAKTTETNYEPEADILRIETGRELIDYASEMGNVVVHFDRKNKSIYFEILEASGFLQKATSLLRPLTRRTLTTGSWKLAAGS